MFFWPTKDTPTKKTKRIGTNQKNDALKQQILFKIKKKTIKLPKRPKRQKKRKICTPSGAKRLSSAAATCAPERCCVERVAWLEGVDGEGGLIDFAL